MKKAYIGFLSFLVLIFSFTAVYAVSTTFTDMDTKEVFNIESLLMINELGDEQYDAELNINSEGASSGDWYLGAFNFAFFDGNAETDILSADPANGSSDTWEIADSGNDVRTVGSSGLSQVGRGGFYPPGLSDNPSNFPNTPNNSNKPNTPNNIVPPQAIGAEIVNGVPVSGNNVPTLNLTFPGNGNSGESIPFQIAYWNNGAANGAANNAAANGNKMPKVGQLNAKLTQNTTTPNSTPVSEPATIILVGAGLLGIGFVSKKRFGKK